MSITRTVRVGALIAGAAVGLLSQLSFPPVAAFAASGTAIVTSISRDLVSSQVPVSGIGCSSATGQPNTAQLFLRPPGASSDIVFSGSASVQQSSGRFSGFVTVPSDAPAGSTFTVSAQCTEQGQPAGVESARIPLPAPGQAYMSFDQGGLPGQPNPNPTVVTTTIAPQTSGDSSGTTTGRATPIARQPQFTG